MDLLTRGRGSLAMVDTEKAEVFKYLKNSHKDKGLNFPSVVPGSISRGSAHGLHHRVFGVDLRKKGSGAAQEWVLKGPSELFGTELDKAVTELMWLY